MPLEFGRVLKEICEDPAPEALAPRQLDQPEPFGHRRSHRLLDRPDVNLGRGIVAERANGAKVWSVLQARAQSVETEEVLVTLGLEHDATDLPAVVDRRLDVLALVKWGQGAAHFRAEVDWRNGVQISVPCAFIEVDAQFLEPAEEGTFRRARVSAGYAWGSSANRSFPTRTFPRVTLAVGASTTVRVPPFAHSLIAYFQGEAGVGLVDATLLGGPLITDRIYQIVSAADLEDSRLTEGVRLPAAARFVRFTNVGGISTNLTAMFGLNL